MKEEIILNDANFAGNSRSTIDFLKNKWCFDCMGCAISHGHIKIPGGIIFEGKHTLLGADPEIPIPGFLIVNTKRHINSFSELNKEEQNEIGNVIVYAEKALKELNIVKEITLVQEERSKHLHIWIFPTHSWMTEKFGKGIQYLRDIAEYAKNNANEDDIIEVLNVIEKVKKYFDQHDINT